MPASARDKYTYVYSNDMATKTLTITVEAYDRLAAKKEPRESFSDVINRITGKHAILELTGTLTPKTANELRAHIEEMRATLDRETERRTR